MNNSQIGMYGLGVMGRNLALNLEENGFQVSIFNRQAPGEETVIQDFMEDAGKGKNFFGADSLESFVQSMQTPRKILVMVKAGNPVDQVIAQMIPFLDKGDIIIDGGNSHYRDTVQRVADLKSKGILFVGMGVSGGEKGARFGPSLMPGGNPDAWPHIKPFFEKISAEAFDGSPCCTWVGNGGAGHFIKMVHNGIEYADMQLLSETYHVLKKSLDVTEDEISEIFRDWNQTELNGYLVEITADIFAFKDEDDQPLINKILDSAGQKGTGKWTAIEALENGVPLPGISQAVYARYVSSLIDIRNKLSDTSQIQKFSGSKSDLIYELKEALLASRIAAYAEGFFMISSMNDEFNWDIDSASIARIWQGGCIIRSVLLKEIEKAFKKDKKLKHLFLSDEFATKLSDLQNGWRSAIRHSISVGIPVPCMMAYLGLYDSLRSSSLPANLIQAQRDYFGAHTYERIDKPRGHFFHTDWENQ